MTEDEARKIIETIMNTPSDIDMEVLALALANALPAIDWVALVDKVLAE